MYFKGPILGVIKDGFNRRFLRESPLCDVAQGQIGKPLSFIKGNPPICKVYYRMNMLKCLSNAQILVHSVFCLTLK